MSNRVHRRLATPAAALLGTALIIGAVGTTAQAATGAQAKASKTVTSVPAKAAGHAITLDGVALQVATPDYPSGQLYTTPAGGLVQVASLSDDAPFRYLSITAVPYGQGIPESGFPASSAGSASAWRATLHSTIAGPTATIFGQKVQGLITNSSGDLRADGVATDLESIHWIVESGSRVWVVTLQHDAASLPTGFGTGLTISSTNPDAKTTVSADAATAVAPATIPVVRPRSTMALAAAVPLGGSLGRPLWWSSDCNGYYPDGQVSGAGASAPLNTKFMGLEVCGYNHNSGAPNYTNTDDRLESNFPYGSVGQYEWECAELSQRYLVQRYSEYGPGGNGSTEADNWYNQYPAQFKLYANGDGKHTPPVPGDVISFAAGSGKNGHTGVVIASNVNASGNGTISMVHQNWNENSSTPGEWDNIPVSNWSVEEVTGEGGSVHWLHNPSDTGVAPTLSITGGIANNGSYSGNVTITVATNTVPDSSAVYLHIDGNASVPQMSGSGTSYSYTLNTNSLAPGTHTIYAGATFGGAATASPADTVTLNPQVQLFAQTPTDLGDAAANYSAGGWNTFKSVYTAAGGSPGTVANYSSSFTEPNNKLHTVANVGGHLYISDGNPTTGTWGGWQDLEATGAAGPLGTVSQVTTTAIGDKLYVVALVGGQIWEASGDYDAGAWSGWANVSTATGVGGSVFSKIAAATTGNTLHLFALNSDGNIYNADGNFTAGTWSAWQNINVSGAGGALPAVPTQIVATTRGTRVELLALVNNGGVGNVYQGGPDYGNGTWSAFGNLSAATGVSGSNFSAIAAAVTANTLHVFALNSDGNIYNADGNYDTGQWSNWMDVTAAGAAGTMPGGYSNLIAAGN